MVILTKKNQNKSNARIKQYIIPASLFAAIISISVLSEAASGSTGVIQEVIKNITTLIKTDGKIGLQILSVAAGGLACAKSMTWQPVVVAGGGVAMIEMLFAAIK